MPAWAGMDVTEVVRAIDDPEFLVAGREIENLLVVRKHDECGETKFGANRDDVLFGVLHTRAPSEAARRGQCGKQKNPKIKTVRNQTNLRQRRNA